MTDTMTTTAPERIWLQIDPSGDPNDRSEPCPDPADVELTWCWTQVGGQEVEYVRADLVGALSHAEGEADADVIERIRRWHWEKNGCQLCPEDYQDIFNIVRRYAAPQVADNVDPWPTLIAIADALGIDPEAARKAPGKPSDVYIEAAKAKFSAPQVAVPEPMEHCSSGGANWNHDYKVGNKIITEVADYARGWNACRDAMLAEAPDRLRAGEEGDRDDELRAWPWGTTDDGKEGGPS